ncbi:MAG: DEAD/DEAH box helicase [Alphaproteobacteria bacterium]|nr:DEAD/DEAH box helicase [Alphaproteobacteria bacterium]
MEGFGPATAAWFREALGAPTRVQAEGWPAILRGEHALLLAPTGSGKTLAAFLSALDRLLHDDPDAPDGVRVLYISPLKALAQDIDRNLRAPLAGIARTAARAGQPVRGVGIDVRTGDTPQRERARQRRRPSDVLVTTPESLYLLLTSAARSTLRSVHTVILDEIHVLAGTKRGVHLALSLERLAAITDVDPQRIGLSATQRPLEVAARFLGGDRTVTVVDTTEPPRLDLRIVVPVDDMEAPPIPERLLGTPVDDDPFGLPAGGALPTATGTSVPLQGGIWPSIHPRLVQAIRAHRSTIVFVNSRLLCERLTAALNDLAGEPLVRAHHGSISHAQRAQTEEELKAGRIPALVATSSLELGIDMGAVDLVVLVASPGSVARGLQRVGRAGHQVGAVSEGRIFPKFRGDLLECAVVGRHMLQGDLEPTHAPRNCLDVLAQQVAAIVADREIAVDALHALVRRAGPYADLSRDALCAVLDMLSGRYPSDELADLSPAISWDRAADVLRPRKGTRLLAVLNGGTIPDRGTFPVVLGADGPRLGELDEEMVFESRSGDVIVLGASSWRIDEIGRDRVLVSPAPGAAGRLPFWRGEGPGRPVQLGRAVGAFVRELTAQPDDEAEAWVQQHAPLDALAARNLLAYVREQQAVTGTVPTDRTVVVERFRDELGDWRICLLTPFGSRVHAPWALALDALMADREGVDVQAFWSDDGIALRVVDGEALPSLDRLLPDPDEVEDLVVGQLRHSAVFAGRFREAAGRALLLPRRRGAKRTPLWLQRRRAAELLAVAQRHPSFPIVLETYRECLQDVFDLPGLVGILRGIRQRAIRVDEVETPSASPFARNLVFQYVAAYLYEQDAPLAERKAAALSLDRTLLRELLGQEELRELLDPETLAQVEAELQHTAPERRARHADALHDLLRRLGDLTEAEIAARTEGDPGPWLLQLEARRQAVAVRVGGALRWIAAEDAGRYRDALGVPVPPGLPAAFAEPTDDPLDGLLRRWARSHGPFEAEAVAVRWGLTPANVTALLRTLETRGLVVHGELRPGGTRREWCDADVLRQLRRRALARLRDEVAPVDGPVLARFLPAWHGVGSSRRGLPRLREVVAQLEGLPLPFSVLEAEVLPARVPDYQPAMLDQLGALGELVWVGRGPLGPKDGRVALVRRERVGLLVDPPDGPPPAPPLQRAVLDHLMQRGASFTTELQVATGADTAELTAALWDLVWAGWVTNDTFVPLRSLAGPSGARQRRVPVAGGRWSAVAHLVGTPASVTERAHARTMALLERHGVVGAPVAQAEDLPGGFSAIYPVLRALEEAGRARRGWFVDGLGGAQFALAGAVDRLRSHRDEGGDTRVLAAADPAQPWGGLLPWPAVAGGARPRREAGARVVLVDGEPLLWLGRGARSMVVFEAALAEDGRLEAAVGALRGSLGFRSLHVLKVDGQEAARHPALAQLTAAGFQRDYKGLLLARQG